MEAGGSHGQLGSEGAHEPGHLAVVLGQGDVHVGAGRLVSRCQKSPYQDSF